MLGIHRRARSAPRSAEYVAALGATLVVAGGLAFEAYDAARSHRQTAERALLLHPSGNGRDTGDLALTVLGQGTHVIPRCSYSYTEYLDQVADIIETTSRVYLELDAADSME